MNPIISVIVPVFNVEKYLSECIDSIVNQTYSNLEIILVDDGSTDKSGSICDEYAKKDSRVRVLHKENRGQWDARNKGLEICGGGIIAFVDSDDYLEPSYFSDLAEGMEADVSVCGCKKVNERGKILSKINATSHNKVYYTPFNYEIIESLCRQSLWGFPVSKLYRAEILKDLRFTNVPFREDLIFNLEVLKRINSLCVLNANGYLYRQREESTLHAHFNGNVPQILETIKKFEITLPYFSVEQNRSLSELFIQLYATDMASKCILRNSTLTEQEKKDEIVKIWGDKNVKRILKFSGNDNKMITFFKACYKMDCPMLYYYVMRKILK